MKSRSYVQFSKRMTVFTLICVNGMMLLCVIGMMVLGDLSALAETMKWYLSFGGVVFIAYCGNSAIEKAALAWAGRKSAEHEEDAANG